MADSLTEMTAKCWTYSENEDMIKLAAVKNAGHMLSAQSTGLFAC